MAAGQRTSHFLHTPSLTTLSRARSTASWHREQMKNLMQMIPNKPIACDNAPCSKSMCQEVTGEASKLSHMLFRQEESTQSFPRVTQKGWKLQQGQQPERKENNSRSHSKEAPASLESWLFATLGYGKTAHKSLIRGHPISTSGAPCSLGDTTNCSARTWERGRSALSLYPLLLHFKAGHKHRPVICVPLLLSQPRGQQPCGDSQPLLL